MFGPGVEIHGGTGTDTLEIVLPWNSGFTAGAGGWGSHIDGIERIDIEDGTSGELILSYMDVANLSDTNFLRIGGDTHDTVRLDDDAARSNLNIGHWARGVTELTSDPTESFTHYDYVLPGGIASSVAIDTDDQVLLV